MKLNQNEKLLIQVERACGDLRRAMPVLITADNGEAMLAISPDNLLYLNSITGNTGKKLVITKTRANYLSDKNFTLPITINADTLELEEINAICSKSPPGDLPVSNFKLANELEQAALKLAKIAELIPAIIVSAANGDYTDLLTVSSSAINAYADSSHYSLIEATRAPLTLQNASNSEIIAYHPVVGGSEHYAIIIGKPDLNNPLVRVHSSCYTGDLLASLSCDCRDQLQSAIELMDKSGGGIILYLMQEGRGIGLVNKLRAYDLKDKGMDTVTANHALGFDDDERLFLPAAEILKKLGIKSLRLLTNNPRKASGLEEYGINVTECVPHIMESNIHNKDYLQTKADKLGHKF